MSRNNNDIWTFLQRFAIIVGIIGGFAGIISATIAVLDYLENRPSQDYTQTQPSDRPTPRVDWKKAILVKTLTGHSNWVYSVAIAPDGKTLASKTLASVSEDGTIKIWSYQTNREIATLTGHSNLVYSVAIAPDGKTLASGSSDKTIKIWSYQTNREIATLTGHSNSVTSVAIAPDGKTLVSGSYDDTIKSWQAGLSE